MSRRRLEKQIAAYRDGALAGPEAEAMRRQLASDPEARLELARHEALGRLTREAWREGPPAPSPDLLIAALRPAMSRVDAELAESRSARWRGWFAPVPIAALGAVAAAALAVAVLRPDGASGPSAPAVPQVMALAAEPSSPSTSLPAALTSEPADEIPVYDLAQGDSPLMVFENDGTTFIWLIEPEKPSDDLSALPTRAGEWV